MACVLDTNVAIHLRDGDPEVWARVERLREPGVVSVVTRVELEGGIATVPHLAERRAVRLRLLLKMIPVLPFDDACADAYGTIVRAAGYSRPRVLDRMIAATALVNGLPLVTMNGEDFRDIEGLRLEIWPAPGRR